MRPTTGTPSCNSTLQRTLDNDIWILLAVSCQNAELCGRKSLEKNHYFGLVRPKFLIIFESLYFPPLLYNVGLTYV